jgi:uncharacterized membrane protein YedE/YeeE
MIALASFACGLLFGVGLLISGMTDPNKVLGFLDLFGAWDATLAFVMAGAVAVSSAGFALARSRGQPALVAQFQWPTRKDIDAPLVIGSALFGLGWGLVGLCPGPALVNLAGLSVPVVVFVITMGAGMMVHDLLRERSTSVRKMEGEAISAGDG